ncbi:hypothetical protein BpOF4_17445 [Alkalihalophilus pseudofirmus OF4]|uniref:Uncharacterized protein n=1 Tax=Alkalihalophilus pseudofirmus (strain ATCC BAA-2126 / JCM 17055 / OF4) TaxID=398511 RepID=D3FRD9_ALKPO|nr:hypothetical protein BpOF4_17445 [Alkalihalophilus pseudofirmus OF4]
MTQKPQHIVSIMDFQLTEHQSIFVQFNGYDAIIEKKFTGEVKFLGGRPYGDIIHPERSSLSSECREYVRMVLLDKYERGEFS